MLRDLTGGASSPLTPLFAFPAIWAGLTGSRRTAIAVVAGIAAGFALPIAGVGAPDYPGSDWLRGVLWVAVAGASAAAILRLRRQAREREERHRTIAEVARDAFVVMDSEGRVREWSPAAEAFFGWSREEAAGAELAELIIPPALREAHRRGLCRFLETGEGPLVGRRVEVTALCRDGHERPVELTISPWRTEEGWLFSAGLHDLSERVRASRMEALAHTDALTRLPNRRGLDEQLVREIARARRTTRPLCVALLDLDRFKDYNDMHGHLAGDQLLMRVAQAWRLELRDSDLVARLGGDEFAVVLPDCGFDDAVSMIARLREATPRGVGCSLGVAEWEPGDDPTSLLGRADSALYADKDARRGGVLAV